VVSPEKKTTKALRHEGSSLRQRSGERTVAMTFFWLIMILALLILLAVDPRNWGQWAREGWTDLGVGLRPPGRTDLEIRAQYRKRACEHVPSARHTDMIRFPDPVLDRLIFDERFDEANWYRMKQLQLARERRDAEMVESYTIYKAHLSARQAEAEERTRRRLRETYPRLVRQEREQVQVSDPMELVTKSGAEAETKRMGFLEIEWKRLPLNLLPIKRPPAPPEPEPTDETDTDKDEFSGLISV